MVGTSWTTVEIVAAYIYGLISLVVNSCVFPFGKPFKPLHPSWPAGPIAPVQNSHSG